MHAGSLKKINMKTDDKIEDSPEFWTTSEFCKVINISPTTVKKLLDAGEINGAVLVGRQYRIHKETFYKDIKNI